MIAELVDPGDAGLHLVDHALHPEAQPTQLGVGPAVGVGGLRGLRRLPGAPRSPSAAASTRRLALEDLVAKPDQLGPLVAQRAEDLAHLGQLLVGFVDVVEASHRADSRASRASGSERG